ncbi:MAG TPA: DinB family protein [Chitinophagales bacterium]|nr:DinB family protein [Chitinophagales bacterium]
MKKDQIKPMPAYFDRYIDKTDDIPVLEVIQASIREIDDLPLSNYEKLGNQVYAPGKWTVKDILQHLIDADRVFAYRATAFSRNEPGQVLSFDEGLYVQKADANRRTIPELIGELKIVRSSFFELYKSFSPEMLLRKGQGFKGEYSVLAIGFMVAGHQRWHTQVITERYLPLLKDKR